jgi:hypothetical protein
MNQTLTLMLLALWELCWRIAGGPGLRVAEVRRERGQVRHG